MSAQVAIRKSPRWLVAIRLLLAAVLCFFFLAITYPSISPGAALAVPFWSVVAVVPFVLITVGAVRRHGMEVFGWILLLLLVLCRVAP